MLGISDAAEYLGMHTLGVKVTFEQLANEAMLPCILHWNQNHFVVCYGIKKKSFSDDYKIYIADPASQKLVYNKGEFCKCWLSTKMSGKDCGSALARLLLTVVKSRLTSKIIPKSNKANL